MITIPPPKDEPAYSPETRATLYSVFKDAHTVMMRGQQWYICHALTRVDGRGSIAHDLIERRLTRMSQGKWHTYVSWYHNQNHGALPIDAQALRILWLENLIEEFA